MDFTKFVSLLDKEALFFCRPDLLGDPFEGALSAATPATVSPDVKAGAVDIHTVDLQKAIRLARVNCWHMGEFESAAMWRLYAREQDGIAIKVVFSDFKSSLVGDQDVYAGVIQYRDYRTSAIPHGNLFLPLIHKRISFQHEREIRALCLSKFAQEAQGEPNGCYCRVDLSKLVGEIVVAPFAEDWFVDLVRSLAHRYGLGDRVRRSTLSDTPTFTARLIMPQKSD